MSVQTANEHVSLSERDLMAMIDRLVYNEEGRPSDRMDPKSAYRFDTSGSVPLLVSVDHPEDSMDLELEAGEVTDACKKEIDSFCDSVTDGLHFS